MLLSRGRGLAGSGPREQPGHSLGQPSSEGATVWMKHFVALKPKVAAERLRGEDSDRQE